MRVWLLRGAALATIICVLACLPTSKPTDKTLTEEVRLEDGSLFTRTLLLEAVGACIVDYQTRFLVKANGLRDASEAAISDSSKRPAAQQAWKDAIDAWQVVELMQVGPAARAVNIAGKDYRDHIYGWPQLNRCAIDKHIVADTITVETLSKETFNLLGLGAVEYTLFNESDVSSCDAADAAHAAFAALSANERAFRRSKYAAAASQIVASQAQALVTIWDPAGGNFLRELTDAGGESRYFRRQQLAFNSISDALFYIEHGVKDAKIGGPAGIIDCQSDACLERLESPWAKRSKTHIRNNLIGFRLLFTGCKEGYQGAGFDDYLASFGARELGAAIDAGIVASVAAVDAITSDDLATAITQDKPSIEALYAAVKVVTDELRTDFVSVLDLELPTQVEGDND